MNLPTNLSGSCRGSAKAWLLVVLGLALFAGGFALSYFGGEEGGSAGSTSSAAEGGGRFEQELESDGILVGLTGSVGIQRGADLVLPATLGRQLQSGDHVSAYAAGAAHVLTREGLLSITSRGAFLLEIEGFEREEIDRVLAYRRSIADRARSAEAAAPEPTELQIERPFGSVLFSNRPAVLWRDSQDSFPYQVVLRKGEQVVFDRRVQVRTGKGETGLLFPGDVESLEYRTSYVVEVTNSDGAAATATFECRPLAELVPYLRPLEELANTLQNDHVTFVLAGLRFGAMGYRDNAVQAWTSVHALLGNERLPIEGILAVLEDAGNSVEIREWLRKLKAAPELPMARIRPAEDDRPSSEDPAGGPGADATTPGR